MVNYNSVTDIQFNDANIEEPVTLAEAKDFCKIDIGTDDDLLISLITAARQMCEAFTGVGFVSHEAVAILNNKNGGIYIPYGPTKEIYEVKDMEGNTLILDQDYTLSGNEFKRLLTPLDDRIEVNYQTGYETLPETLKLAILNQIYYLYDNRSQGADGIAPIAKMLLTPFRRV